MTTINQALATVLGLSIKQTPAGPLWVQKFGLIEKDIGLVRLRSDGTDSGLSLEQAVWKAWQDTRGESECSFIVLPKASPRASIYMEIEATIMRQELRDSELMSDAIAENDPRDAITLLMEHLRICAMECMHPNKVIINFMRMVVLAIAAYEWSMKWFATLQLGPLEGQIEPGGSRRFAFPTPTNKVPEPIPLKLVEEEDGAEGVHIPLDTPPPPCPYCHTLPCTCPQAEEIPRS